MRQRGDAGASFISIPSLPGRSISTILCYFLSSIPLSQLHTMLVSLKMPEEGSFYFEFRLQYFDYAVEIMFGIDIILKCFTAYVDDETGDLVTDKKRILKHYIFSWRFFIDFVSTFPMYLFFSDGEFTKILRMIRLPKTAKLFDSSKFENCIECIMKSKANLMQSNWERMEQITTMSL